MYVCMYVVATLGSVANTIANVTGLLCPYLGMKLLDRFNGSWFPLLALAGTLKWVCGAWVRLST